MTSQEFCMHGWFKMPRDSIEVIKRHLGSTPRGPTARVVFEALCDLSNAGRLQSFEANIALIAHVAGVSYRTAHARLKDLRDIGVIAIASTGPGGLDRPRTYSICSTTFAERSASPDPPELPTGMNNPKTSPPTPTPAERERTPQMDDMIARFRALRPELRSARIQDHQIMAAIEACPPGEDRNRGFEDFVRDIPTLSSVPSNPVKLLRGYMVTASKGPKPSDGALHAQPSSFARPVRGGANSRLFALKSQREAIERLTEPLKSRNQHLTSDERAEFARLKEKRKRIDKLMVEIEL